MVLEYRQELKRVPGVLRTLTKTLTTIVVLPVRANYDILTAEERCKLNILNPVNPTTGRRFEKIHQYLDDETKSRIYPKVCELHALLKASNSRQEFLMLIGRINGLDRLGLFPDIS